MDPHISGRRVLIARNCFSQSPLMADVVTLKAGGPPTLLPVNLFSAPTAGARRLSSIHHLDARTRSLLNIFLWSRFHRRRFSTLQGRDVAAARTLRRRTAAPAANKISTRELNWRSIKLSRCVLLCNVMYCKNFGIAPVLKQA